MALPRNAAQPIPSLETLGPLLPGFFSKTEHYVKLLCRPLRDVIASIWLSLQSLRLLGLQLPLPAVRRQPPFFCPR